VFAYVLGLLRASPALAREIASVKRNEIELRNGIVIAVHSNSFRTVRGRTLVAAVLDEVSFWRDDTTANPDVETYRAVLPSLATTNGMLVGISTPYRRLGLLHQKHRDHFAQDGDEALVVQGSSQQFNITLSDETIAQQRHANPLAASSEWDAEFRSDISSFLDDRLIEQAVEIGRPLELPPLFADARRLADLKLLPAAGEIGVDGWEERALLDVDVFPRYDQGGLRRLQVGISSQRLLDQGVEPLRVKHRPPLPWQIEIVDESLRVAAGRRRAGTVGVSRSGV
jgi:hypothetical protein